MSQSELLFERARKVIAGGVSRNLLHQTPCPDYASSGLGSQIMDIDGVRYVDFANNSASLIHGHAHPTIVAMVSAKVSRGTAFSMATEAEVRFAEHLCSRNGGFEKIRFTNSGTEAVMAALKAARAITGRPKIAKIEGAYHGTYDLSEISQSSAPSNWGDPANPASTPHVSGTPLSVLDSVVTLPFNQIESTLNLLKRNADDLAAVLVDPMPLRLGLIPATQQWIEALREWTTQNGVLLIFDEVITFRLAFGGFQSTFPVHPDLTVLGKIIGGGFPIGAVVGKSEWMAAFDCEQTPLLVPFSGTFSGNPISMTAGRVAMEIYDQAEIDRLHQISDFARQELESVIQDTGFPGCITGMGSLLQIHLRENPPTDYRSAVLGPSEKEKNEAMVDAFRSENCLLHRSGAVFLSTAHTESDIEQLVTAFRKIVTQAKS